MKREYNPRESRLINQWIREKHPTTTQWKRVRLGAIPGTTEDKLYAGVRRWADLIMFDGTSMIIIEAKMRPQPEGIAELEVYRKLLPKTPEFSAFSDKPIRLVFLTTIYDETISELCKEKGIELEVFRPPWVVAWWEERIRAGRSIHG